MPAHLHVIPCYKKGDKHTPGKCRSISLLCIMSKVTENLVSKKIWKHLDQHHLISPRQFGFRAGHSTSDALTYVSRCLANLLNNREEGSSALTSEESFTVCGTLVCLKNFLHWGLQVLFMLLLTDCLKDRSLKVILNLKESGVKRINSGTPQSSVLGPLLFIIFIDDISQDQKKQSILYADDATIMPFVKSSEDRLPAPVSLNQDLAKIETWAKTWNVLFGAAKCKTTTFSNRRDDNGNHLPLHFFGVTLAEADSVDLLGLTLNNNLSCNHVVTNNWQHPMGEGVCLKPSNNSSYFLWFLDLCFQHPANFWWFFYCFAIHMDYKIAYTVCNYCYTSQYSEQGQLTLIESITSQLYENIQPVNYRNQ